MLNPCPYCGKYPRYKREHAKEIRNIRGKERLKTVYKYYFKCGKCHIRTLGCVGMGNALNEWNAGNIYDEQQVLYQNCINDFNTEKKVRPYY